MDSMCGCQRFQVWMEIMSGCILSDKSIRSTTFCFLQRKAAKSSSMLCLSSADAVSSLYPYRPSSSTKLAIDAHRHDRVMSICFSVSTVVTCCMTFRACVRACAAKRTSADAFKEKGATTIARAKVRCSTRRCAARCPIGTLCCLRHDKQEFSTCP